MSYVVCPQTHCQKSSWLAEVTSSSYGRNATLSLYIKCFQRRVQTDVINEHHPVQQNLNHAERKAIESLRNNPDFIMKEADEGGAIVIMNRSDYIQEAERQVSNTAFYKQLYLDPTQEYRKELKKNIMELPLHVQEQILSETPQEPQSGAASSGREESELNASTPSQNAQEGTG